MKTLIFALLFALIGLGVYYHIDQTTRETTLKLLEDDARTEWVKCAKECKVDTIINLADSINTEDGDEIR